VTAPAAALWSPTPSRRARANVTRFLSWLRAERGLRFSDYASLWRWSVDELEDFWSAVWGFYGVRSATPVGRPLGARDMPGARWFDGSRLNYAEHVLERAPSDRSAVIHLSEGREPQEISAAELRGRVGALAATLARLGVREGDRVAAYLPNLPEAVMAMLATTSLGAVWAACAPDFGTRSVVDRFCQLEPKVLIAVDGYRFNGVDHDRRPAIRELREALPSVEATILVRLLDPGREPGDMLSFEAAVEDLREPDFRHVPFDHPLWVLFSSGTTGLPKGIVHGHGGILLEHLKSLGLCMDLGPEDRYFFFSSTSWMAWNYLVGGLLHGSTIVLYNGAPAKPTPDALWQVAAATRSTVLGMGSAYVAGCEKSGVQLRGHVDLGHLRTVIPTGAPLAPGGWRWLHRELGERVRIDSICGGTDVCTAFFGGSELLPVHLGEVSCPWLGVDAHAFDAAGNPVLDTVGEFVVTSPMPSMPVGLWNDDDDRRLRAAYFEMFPGVWRQGDWIRLKADGAVTVLGRSDATLNRAGVRIGSAEIYGAVERLPEVVDSLVVGLELGDGGYYMPLFVVSESDDHEALEAAVRRIVREQLSPRHVPDEVVAVPVIPRTLTGKKLEVPIKRILQGVPPQDAAALGSVDRPEALEWFARFAARRRRDAAEAAR
jgi:acetoacetyl-CoA synthetase